LAKKYSMTFEEAVEKVERIKSYTKGLPFKGVYIERFFIGPTDWEEMTDYLNAQIQRGNEIARIEFSKKSFSVYGVAENKLSDGTPRWDMLNLDRWEEEISN